MAFTAAQITALERAIATGATLVRYADRTVQYRSLAEMEALLSRMRDAVEGSTRTRQLRVRTDKGF